MALLLLFQGTSGETSEQPKDVSTSTNWPSAYTWHFSCSPIGLYLLGSGSLMLRNVAHHFWFCFSFCYIHFEQLSWGLIFLQPISCYYRWNWFCLFGVLVVACYVLQVLPKNLALCPSESPNGGRALELGFQKKIESANFCFEKFCKKSEL